MTAPLKLIEQGLKSKDWESVRQGYKALTGEDISDSALTKTKSPKAAASARSKKTKDKAKTILINDDETSNKTITTTPTNKSSGPVKITGENRFVTNKEDKKLINLSREVHKHTESIERNPYKPLEVKCSRCQSKFDFNKEYPGSDISKVDILECNSCKTKNRRK